MKLNDAVFGGLLVALGALVLGAVQGYPRIPGQPVGPALFPGLIAAGLCLCGLILVVRGWRQRHEQRWFAWDDWVRSPRHVLAFALAVGSVLFYILVSERLGFLPSATLILLALFLVLRVPPGRAVLVAVLAALLVHLAFYKLLRVPLPWGVLKGIAW
ncbi:MAG TPA: tripartite tricarboxylate transporter TctB family protein [Ramlibacter sp.]|jgi:putative tricarboxylic transport membrane protein|uniref:tripartite tricarboxylate transporter TctB family protein n=1 Tax=Ramlibacter sp. TaxID=1917967 RepID=UPI002D4ABC1C|nr:tripartite tricarboxylate transporter TctB family protein [Ramlibacter sp.]HZY18137.1 tripartite tricarboxylate transporter TctB family protein [Ramlibacter sp.]